MGINIPTKEELVANRVGMDKIAAHFGEIFTHLILWYSDLWKQVRILTRLELVKQNVDCINFHLHFYMYSHIISWMDSMNIDLVGIVFGEVWSRS